MGSSPEHFEATPGADLCVGVDISSQGKANLQKTAGWTVRSFSQLTQNLKQYQVAFIGSGKLQELLARLSLFDFLLNSADSTFLEEASALFNCSSVRR